MVTSLAANNGNQGVGNITQDCPFLLSLTYDDFLATQATEIPFQITYDDGITPPYMNVLDNKGKHIIKNPPKCGRTVEYGYNYKSADVKKIKAEIEKIHLKLKQAVIDIAEDLKNEYLAELKNNPIPKLDQTDSKAVTYRKLLTKAVEENIAKLQDEKDKFNDLNFLRKHWEIQKSMAKGVGKGVWNYIPDLGELGKMMEDLNIPMKDMAFALIKGDIDGLQKSLDKWKDKHKGEYNDAVESMEIIILLLSDKKTREILLGLPKRYLKVMPTNKLIEIGVNQATQAGMDAGAVTLATAGGAALGGVGAPILGGAALLAVIIRKAGKILEVLKATLLGLVKQIKKLKNRHKDKETTLDKDKNKDKLNIKITQGSTASLSLTPDKDNNKDTLILNAKPNKTKGTLTWKVDEKYFDVVGRNNTKNITLTGKEKGVVDVIVSYTREGKTVTDKISVTIADLVKCDWNDCTSNHEKNIVYPKDGRVSKSSTYNEKWKIMEPWLLHGPGKNSKGARADYEKETPGKPDYMESAINMVYPEYHTQKHHIISATLFSNLSKLINNIELIGYNVNHKKNGICLPSYRLDIVQHNLQCHRGSHSNDLYYDKVLTYLKKIEVKCVDYCVNDKTGDLTSQKKLIDKLNTLSSNTKKNIIDWKWFLRSDALNEKKKSETRFENL